ncbi:hypothetical protein [Sinisalibacter aestuarii]|uniref:AMIN domain-containing protein n=1 Tax=Sinisalibacter aestuarii TaxID=2949426 RepID=A0ABQ5LRZ9_9RHOB|nr:hypothetical protein [Sinisalibacter aestuarii]GKY87779.1 hypothetical protein STA1M1_16480 [Sinisalibacter aestuarii]
MPFARFALAALLALAPAAASAQSCAIVELEAGFTAGDLSGIAPPEGVLCYELHIPRGQNMSIEVINGINVAVTVPDYYDARSARTFIGDLPERLELRVFQLLRSVRPEPFTVRLRFEPPGNG